MSCGQDSQGFLHKPNATCREDLLDEEAVQDGLASEEAPRRGELSLCWWYQLFTMLVLF